jgi:hypothetical protein
LGIGEFKRGIKNQAFLKSLEQLARREGWWRDVLRDPTLIFAVRD